MGLRRPGFWVEAAPSRVRWGRSPRQFVGGLEKLPGAEWPEPHCEGVVFLWILSVPTPYSSGRKGPEPSAGSRVLRGQ